MYGLVTAVERNECGGNSSLILLSVISLIVCGGGKFLLHLGNRCVCGLFFGEVRLNVRVYGICRLIPCRRLLRLFKLSVFLLLLFHSSGNK